MNEPQPSQAPDPADGGPSSSPDREPLWMWPSGWSSLRNRTSRLLWLAAAGGLCLVGVGVGASRGLPDGGIAPELVLHPQNAGMPWSFRETNGVDRYEVRQGNKWDGDSKVAEAKERSEAYASRKLPIGETFDVLFSMMVERGPKNTAPWMTLVQLQSTFDAGEDGHSPPFAIELAGEKMRVVSRTSLPQISTPANTQFTSQYVDKADIRHGRWYKMKVRVRFDPHGNGLLMVWRDGKQLVDYHGAIGFNDRIGAYFKEGVYRGSAKEPFAARYKGLAINPLT